MGCIQRQETALHAVTGLNQVHLDPMGVLCLRIQGPEFDSARGGIRICREVEGAAHIS